MSANLIANGSFEDVADDDAGRPQEKGSTAITGWVVTGRDVGESDSVGRRVRSLVYCTPFE